jgi:hypothetical protein
MNTPQRPARPSGLRRTAFRIPILLYRARLGGLLGHRFVLIHHTGRRTGLPRQVVVEVVTREPESGAVVVASGDADYLAMGDTLPMLRLVPREAQSPKRAAP